MDLLLQYLNIFVFRIKNNIIFFKLNNVSIFNSDVGDFDQFIIKPYSGPCLAYIERPLIGLILFQSNFSLRLAASRYFQIAFRAAADPYLSYLRPSS